MVGGARRRGGFLRLQWVHPPIFLTAAHTYDPLPPPSLNVAQLLQKQREGKKRMKTVGNISLPQEAFHAIISKK